MQELTAIEEQYVKNIYENIADRFSSSRVYTWSWIDKFLENLDKDSLIYDIGCGNGRNMIHDKHRFIGVDNCEKLINICKSKNLDVINSNITNIPLESNTCDTIICIAVFHHLSNKINREKALLEMKRLIKDGGTILLSVWSINQPKKTRRTFYKYGDNIVLWNNYGTIYERYYYIFEIHEIKDLFKKAGLLLINHEYDCGNEIFILSKV